MKLNFQNCKSRELEYFKILFRKNFLPKNNLVFLLKKKYFNAVKRNYIKRVMRQLTRESGLDSSYDIFLLSKKKIKLQYKVIVKNELNHFLELI